MLTINYSYETIYIKAPFTSRIYVKILIATYDRDFL